jgi:hypothetical protein
MRLLTTLVCSIYVYLISTILLLIFGTFLSISCVYTTVYYIHTLETLD